MISLSNLSQYWSADLVKYFKPSELFRGVVAGCRLAWNSLAGIDKITSSEVPVGIGDMYKPITLQLSSIQTNKEVAGIGKAFEDFPYMIVGAPEGIIYFSKSATSIGASLYCDFIEYSGVYYFKDNPTKYGIVSAKHGNTCTFVVAVCGQKTLKFQDMSGKYQNSGSYMNNRTIADYDSTSAASIGISNEILLLQSGNTPAPGGTSSKMWKEGGVYWAINGDKLICDRCAKDETDVRLNVPAGSTISDKVYSDFLLYPDKDGFVRYVDGAVENVITSAYPGLSNYIDASVVPYKNLPGILRESGIVTMNCSNGDSDVQLAVERRVSNVSSLYAAKLLKVTITADQWFHGADSSDSETTAPTHCYAYFGYGSTADSPKIFSGIRAREAVLNNLNKYTVMRIPLQPLNGRYIAVSDNAQVFGDPVVCGMFVKALVLINHDEGSDYSEDVILKSTQLLKPEFVHAGKCFVFDLTIETVG